MISYGYGFASAPMAALAELPDAPAPPLAAAVIPAFSTVFFVVEIDAFRPGSAALSYDMSFAAAPVSALAELPDSIEATATILASDQGYRTSPADAGGVVPYPPYLSQAFSVDRKLNLDPGQSAVAAAWGMVQLSNQTGVYDTIAGSWNSDGRTIRILAGAKTWDTGRGIFLDPPYTALVAAFVGVATPWFLSDTTLSVPLQDATYWLEQPIQGVHYAGVGGYEGTADLAGTPLPKLRGGLASAPVCNITPVLMDAVNRIYQYTDGPGAVVNLYEGASLTYAGAGDTSNLYAGVTPSGHYRTDNSRGLFQLGNTPSGAITLDAVGSFPIAGAVSTVGALALYLLTEDMLLPESYIDLPSFYAADESYPYVAGAFWDASSTDTGVTAVDTMLSALGAKLVPNRDGTLSLFVLRALPGSAMAAAAFDTTNTVSMTPVALPSTLDPPPYRWRVGYQHNYTVQASGVLPSATPAQQAYVTAADRYSSFSSNAILTAYRRPNDPAPVISGLLRQADAQTLATDLGALWSTRRRLYDVVVPLSIGLRRDIGDVVNLTWPMDDLTNGRLGQIVGEQFRAGDAQITYRVLV